MTEKEIARLGALIEPEREFRSQGIVVAGCDEVGRGPLAGPVTVACVIMPEDPLVEFVNDSKKVTEKRRDIAAAEIRGVALSYNIVSIPPDIVDEINILRATEKAMREAALGMKTRPELLFIDAVKLEGLPFDTRSVIGGDAKIYSIAAASILAKTTRDAFMREMDLVYPMYGFAKNKGYGTAEHIAALKKFGPCPIHRRSFIKGIMERA